MQPLRANPIIAGGPSTSVAALCKRQPTEEQAKFVTALVDNLGLLFVPPGLGVIAYVPPPRAARPTARPLGWMRMRQRTPSSER